MQYICNGSNYLYYFSGLALLLFHFLFYCHFVTVFKTSESNDLFTTLSYYCLGTYFELTFPTRKPCDIKEFGLLKTLFLFNQ